MSIALTGGTGLIGGAVLRELIGSGHEVTAAVRSDEAARTVEKAGATAVVGDLTDHDWLVEQLASSKGAIHTASPGDASSADFDLAVVRAVVAAYAGTAKRYVHTGGCWVWGSGTDLTEASPFAPPELTAWRYAVERELLDSDVHAAIVAPGIVYAGPSDGLPALIALPDDQGRYRLVGDGSQHWTTVSDQQVAELYRLALETQGARGYFLGVNADHPTVREIAEAAAGDAEAVAETPEESRERLNPLLVDALLLDQVAHAARAEVELGWAPAGPSLVEMLSRSAS